MRHRPSASRRQFLKVAAASALAAPYLVAAPLRGAAAPSNRITLGFIGVGGRNSGHLNMCCGLSELQVLAVCDVDSARLTRARQSVASAYASRNPAASGKQCVAYNDFRELLARDDIDAVFIGTPDHWHALISIAAAKAGKDIYCEKPLTVFPAEGPAVIDAVRRHNRVLQVGSQERSGRGGHLACELVRNQRIGKLHTVRVTLPVAHGDPPAQAERPVPPGFDYDMWLGPAPFSPYVPGRTHGSFRFVLDYSGGEMTDRGAHVGDIALWGCWPFLKGPTTIEGKGVFCTGLFDTARQFRVQFDYASGVRLIVESVEPRGIRFEGDRGWIFCAIHGGALSASSPDILQTPIRPDEIRLYRSPGHQRDFFNAVRSRGEVVAPPEEGHKSAMLCHLSNIALRLGRKLTWDHEREVFINDPEANRLLVRPMRSPWTL